MIWKILEIEKTKDEEVIRNAYHEKLHDVNPEDDAEGFKELRRAFEEAMEYAALPEGVEEAEETEEITGQKNDVDLWIDRIEKIYNDAALRRDESKWKPLLNDPICDDLDTELEAAEKLLVFFMSHNFLPQNIWQLVDSRFHYLDNFSQLVEKFPENYLEYVKWQIENEGFINFTLFDGKTDDNVDEFINKLYEVKNYVEKEELDEAKRVLGELKRFELTHPYLLVEEANYLMAKAEKDENGLDYKKRALSIMEDLDFEYSDNNYIERVYADVLSVNDEPEKAMKIYEMLLEKDFDNYNAKLGKATCIYKMGDLEEAKEQIEDVLEEQVNNTRCLELLDEINEKLVEKYKTELSNEKNADTTYKLGWCYYQQKKFDEGIQLLDFMEDADEYDYINLRCRLYLANEDYAKAYPMAKRWIAMIEETVDDGSRDAKKKKNRLSLAYFSLGICAWENDYKQAESEEEKKAAYQSTTEYLDKAIDAEKNVLVRLSYMEQLARFYLETKEYEQTIDICTKIIDEDRGFFPAYVHRQKANYELKNAKEVIDDFFACKELYAAYLPPYLLAAEVFYAFDQYDDVEHVIEAAKEAELDSDTLKLYEIRILHYKDFSDENTRAALEKLRELRDVVYQKIKASKDKDNQTEETEGTDIEDLADLEKEHAILYWDLDDIKMTLGIINSFLEEYPDSVTMLHLKIDVLNRNNEEEKALEECKRLVQIEPDSLYNLTKLGNCYERTKHYSHAIQTYEDILKINPKHQQALRRLMYVYSFLSNRERDLKKCEQGISYATRFIEISGTAEGYVERGNLLIDLYKLEEAVNDCRKAIELDPEAFYAYNNLGCALLKLRRIDEAIEPLEHIIKAEPEYDALPYLNLAECYALKNRYDKAIELYRRVMKIWEKRAGLKKEVAKLYAKMGEYDKAIKEINEIPDAFLKIYGGKINDTTYIGNQIEAYCDTIKFCSENMDYNTGKKYVKLAMKALLKYKGKHFPSKIDNIIEFYRDMGDGKNAEKYAKKLLDIGNKRGYNGKEIVFAYTTVLFELGKKEDAAKSAKAYLQKLYESEGPEEELFLDKRYIPMHAYNLAIMNICIGNLEKACELLARIPDCKLCVMCVSSDCFEYYFGLGLIAEINGRLLEAKTFYEKAIEIKGRYACCEHHLRKVNDALNA